MKNKVIRNGQTMVLEGKICPFRTPILIPSQIQGNLSLQAFSCGNECPHFTIESTIESMNDISISLNCVAKPKIYYCDLEELKQNNGLKL